MRAILSLLVVTLLLSSCLSRSVTTARKSPCTDNGGPCKHIPVNNWWLPDELKYNVVESA